MSVNFFFRTLNHRFFRLRPRPLGGTLMLTGTALLGASVVISSGSGIAGVTIARAANTGTVKVQNAGGTASNDNEPHLSCDADIQLWGSDFGSTSGAFTVDLQSPSGSGTAYNGSFIYSATGTDPQLIATVPEADLFAGAVLAGDASAGTSGSSTHFKVSSSNDTFKSKVFWVDCSPASTPTSTPDPTATPTPTPTPTATPTPTPTATPTPDSTATPTPTPTATPTTTSTTTDNGGVEGTGGTQSTTGTPPNSGATTTTTTSAPVSTTGSTSQPAGTAVVPVQALSVPEAGADVPFLSGLLLLLAGGGVLLAERRRSLRQ